MGWNELNAGAGAKPVQTIAPTGAQAGGWAAANAGVTKRAAPQVTQQQVIQNQIKASQPAIPTVAASKQGPFFENTKISAPAQKKFGIKGITFNKPGTGLPMVDVDNPRVEVGEGANFVQKGLGAAANVFGSSLTGLTKSLGELFDISLATPYDDGQKAAYQSKISSGQPTLNPAIDSRISAGKKPFPTGAEKVGAGLNVATAAANADFALVAAELEAAKELPVVGKPIFGTISKGFELLDKASRFAGSKVVDILPVSEESRAVLRAPIEDLAGILGTLAGVKGVHKVSSSKGGRAVDVLPVSEKSKVQIKSAVGTGAAFAMQPFSTAYKAIIGTMRGKVEQRTGRGEEVTPDVAKVIVNESVKENPTPDLPSRMTVITPDGKVQINTNQKLVLENLIKGREDIEYRVVDNLGNDPVTGEPMTSRFDWDYPSQRAIITTTDKTTAVNLAHELGHYVDRAIGSELSKTLSDVLPEYRENRDQINQMLADYALDRLDGQGSKKDIDAEILKIAKNLNDEIKVISAREARQTPAQQFAGAFGDVINDPKVRSSSPELAQLVDFAVGDASRKGAEPDLRGEQGSVQEKASVLNSLESNKRAAVRNTVKNDETFQNQEISRRMKREAIEERGAMGSANFAWGDAAKAIRASKEFKKEGAISDRTIQGTIMEKNGKVQLVPLSDVRKMAADGWTVKFSMDEIANANGFESAEDYYTFVSELDAETRAISRSSTQKAAHEYLMKNDPEYAKLTDTIDTLREELINEEAVIRADEQSRASKAERVPTKKSAEGSLDIIGPTPKGYVDLYRGMEQKFDKSFDLSKTDAPNGYSTWTDNPKLARQYAGENGYVYKIRLPESERGNELVNADGDRVLFLNNEKKAGLNNVSGQEYLVYNYHDNYSPDLISEVSTSKAQKASEEFQDLEPVSPIEGENTRQSRVFERIKAEMPEQLEGDVSYNTMNMVADVEKATKLVMENKQKAYKVAMGLESLPDQTSTAVNIALADAALEAGNLSLYAQLTKTRSLAQTRRGQEIVAEKGSVTDNSTSRYLKDIIHERMNAVGKSFLGDARQLIGAGETSAKRAVAEMDAQVKEAQKHMKKNTSKRFDIEAAQKLIDKLACA